MLDGPGCAGGCGVVSASRETEIMYGDTHWAMIGLAASP
jgi:hypothetical protein